MNRHVLCYCTLRKKTFLFAQGPKKRNANIQFKPAKKDRKSSLHYYTAAGHKQGPKKRRRKKKRTEKRKYIDVMSSVRLKEC